MPGIYVQDGGATSSALGNILGGIAQQVGPEAAAKAQLLYQQTQGADIANERSYTQQVLDANAARQAGGILATGGADAQPPGGVPGAVAKLAQPPITGPGPGGRYPLVDTTGMTPNQTYMAQVKISRPGTRLSSRKVRRSMSRPVIRWLSIRARETLRAT